MVLGAYNDINTHLLAHSAGGGVGREVTAVAG